ncbi:LysR family transcriptional regulator [Alteribacter populi]|uniref:LysR family transcriptional regulator n=1 Tax=Alteribacter populi TaxID=2011011 RepID=UPI000BBAAB79|nr:LysR family transcriptional regulator [Alteribacter populi]
MDPKQLKTFLTAAETLNFTKTASILNFAQSSVTAQIKSLEESLGKPLFERLGKRLILTEAGQSFRVYAEKMVKLSDEARIAISGNQEPSGTLVIGAQESQCTYRLPPVLTEFKRLYPKVELIFKPAHSDQLAREQLMKGILDAAFIMDVPKPEEGLTIEELLKEEIKLVTSPDHPLAKKSEVILKDIEKETLLLTETGCSYRNLLEQSCQSAQVYPAHKIEFGSIEAIKQCAIAGLGIGVLPTMVVVEDLKKSKVVELNWKSDIPPIFTQIAWHKDKWLSPPLESFIELTMNILKNRI